MANITLYLNDDYVKDDGTKAAYLVTHIHGKKVRINTKVSIHPDYFDPIKKQVIGNSKELKDARLIIEQCRSRINEILVNYRLMKKDLTADIFRKEYENPTSFVDFYGFMERTMAQKRGLNSENTLKAHGSLKEKLKKFRPVLMFADIDEIFISDFQKYMKTKLDNNANTIAKTLRNFKIYINAAKRQGLIKESPFQDIRIRQVEAEREFLDPEELELLMKKYDDESLPDKYRETFQAFLFSCFTGLRISDAKEVRMEQIQKKTLVFIPVKTEGINKTVRVPLSDPAKMILKDVAPHRVYGKIFNLEADQTVNKKLKKIFTHFEIQKNISFHCARHTFATIFLRRGGKLHILQKLMGHYSITETMKYVHILPDDTEEEVKLFNAFDVSKAFDQMVAISNLINWDELSYLLTKSRGIIKRDNFSEHKPQVDELLNLINTWYDKHFKPTP